MFNRFTNVVNNLETLGNIYLNLEMIRKILNSLPISREPKFMTILEVKDLIKFEINELIKSLIIHEYTLKIWEEKRKSKKNLTFKDVSQERESEEDGELQF